MLDPKQLLSTLNDEQQKAVLYIDGHSLILAGAGSGKTRVLTTKVAYLISQGYAPHSIMALTFTNKAAAEMRGRISQLLGRDVAQAVPMGTFHSLFARMLRRYAQLLGYTSAYTIYDTGDSKALLKQIVKDLKLSDKTYRIPNVQSLISSAKNNMIPSEQYIHDSSLIRRDTQIGMPRLREIYAIYEQRCRKANAMDFDDLLLNTLRLLRHNKKVLMLLQQVYKYILVDEYQDTNRVQHEIVKQLCSQDCKLCVVGDDSQSIYSFRGAVIDNILQFENSFQGARRFILSRNYRSTSNIVNVAESLIAKNVERLEKEIVSVQEAGEKVSLISSYSANIEAQAVGAKIQYLIDHKGVNPEEIAILYRTNAQSRILEDTIRLLGIKTRVYGGMSFYERKEVKDLIAYMRLIVNPDDDEAFRRVFNFPTRGLGQTSFQKLHEAALSNGISYMECIEHAASTNDVFSKATLNKWLAFVELIKNMSNSAKQLPLDQVARLLLKDSGMYEYYHLDKSSDAEERLQNLSELINAVSEYMSMKEDEGAPEPSLEDYLREIALYTDRDEVEKDNSPKVTMMTLHASKGLEYDYVFVVGVEDGLLPSERSLDSINGLEEERRLLYVGITRAKKSCVLSFAYGRSNYGRYMSTYPSRFLYDLDPQFIRNESDLDLKTKKKSQLAPENSFSEYNHHNNFQAAKRFVSSTPKIKVNTRLKNDQNNELPDEKMLDRMKGIPYEKDDRVNHPVFGNGTVLNLMDSISGIKININFDKVGTKSLIIKYAKLKKIN